MITLLIFQLFMGKITEESRGEKQQVLSKERVVRLNPELSSSQLLSCHLRPFDSTANKP